MRHFVRRIHTNQSGATAIEYGLIVALIALVCVVALRAVGTNISSVLNQISAALSGG